MPKLYLGIAKISSKILVMPNKIMGMENNLDERISENLRFEIEHCGKRKIDIAKGIGVNSSTISQYLSGRAQPTLATLSKLCNFIGCSADDILEIKNQ